MGARGRQRLQFDVSLKTLIDHGTLRVGPKSLLLEARNKVRKGDLNEDGSIDFEGKTFSSPSSFAVAALRSAGATTRMTANGWQLVTSNGRSLEVYRADYLSEVYGVPNTIPQAKESVEESTQSGGSNPSPQEKLEKPPSTPPSEPPTPATVEEITNPESTENDATSRLSNPAKDDGDAEEVDAGIISPQAGGVQEVVASMDERSNETSSDGASTQMAGNSRKRPAPRPELQMWLKKALKKRHVESQEILQGASEDVR